MMYNFTLCMINCVIYKIGVYYEEPTMNATL